MRAHAHEQNMNHDRPTSKSFSSSSSSSRHDRDQDNFSQVDSLVAKFSANTQASTPETFAEKQKQQQAETKRSLSKARDNITGIRLSLGSAMAAVKPKTIAKMVTNARQLRHTKSGQQSTLVASPSHLSVESSNPTFGEAQQEDHTMEVSGNPLRELALAIQRDGSSNLLTHMERCRKSVNANQPLAEIESGDSRSDAAAQELRKIYAMLHANIEASNVRDAVLLASAYFNRVAIMQAILSDYAAHGVEWSSQQERALEFACTNGHLEVASLLACVDGDKVGSQLNQSLALRYYCLAGDMVRAREILLDDTHDVAITAALLDGCRNGHCDAVSLLTADPRFDASVDGEDALREACVNGHVEVVSLLLRDNRLPNDSGMFEDALERAADAGHCEVVAVLVQDPRVNPGLDKCFALEQYCLVGDVNRAEVALGDPELLGCLPDYMVIDASRNGHAAIVKLLLADPRVDPAAENNWAIRNASFYGHASVVKLLLADLRVDPAAINNDAIRDASDNGHAGVVKLLMADPRVDPAAGTNYAIEFSSRYGHESVVKLLLTDPRVNPAAENNWAIRNASANGYAGVVKLLLGDPRVDPAAFSSEAIRMASFKGHEDVVKLLLADPRVDPAAISNDALLNASYNGRHGVVELLLADPRVRPAADNNHAIRYACFERQPDDFDGSYGAEEAEAMRAARLQQRTNTVQLLLADPRVDPSVGHPTALERASESGFVNAVHMLLGHPKVVVTKAALVNADKGGFGDIVRLLIEKQPRVLQDLFEGATLCESGGALQSELLRIEKASALTLLLAVGRMESAVRVSDVLRDVIVECACFNLTENVVDASASTPK